MKQKIKRTNEEWVQIFHRRVASGLSIRKWCNANGISYDAYKYWEQRLHQRPAEISASPAPSFVEFLPKKEPDPSANIFPAPDWPFRLSFHDFQISVASGADPSQLYGLLKVLRELC